MAKQGELFDPKRFPPRDPKELREKFPNMRKWHPRHGYGPHQFKKIPDEWIVRFTKDDLEFSHYLGRTLREKGMRETGKTSFGNGTTSAEDDAAQFLGERGNVYVAKKFDLAFTADWKDRWGGAPDFGRLAGPGIEVRCVQDREYPRLRVKPHDCPICASVLVVELELGVARLQAWCWAFAAKLCTDLTKPRPLNAAGEVIDAPPIHMVPLTLDDGSPNPIMHFFGDMGVTLPERVLAACPKGYKPWQVK